MDLREQPRLPHSQKIAPITALNQGSYVLDEAGVPSPRYDAREILEHVMGCRLHQASHQLNAKEFEQYLMLIGARAQGKPLQHLLGKMYFRRLTLKSRPGVFIVRPETEVIVDAGLKIVRELIKTRYQAEETSEIKEAKEIKILDLCSGSGAIALSLASETKGIGIPIQIAGIDINEQAVQLAQENRDLCQVDKQIHFYQYDVRSGLPPALSSWKKQVDLVITNPPYVAPGNVNQVEALADPPLALYGGGKDGSKIGKEILQAASQYLRPGGSLIMEHAENQHPVFATCAHKLGYRDIVSGTDLNGALRYTQARWAS